MKTIKELNRSYKRADKMKFHHLACYRLGKIQALKDVIELINQELRIEPSNIITKPLYRLKQKIQGDKEGKENENN